MRELLSFREGVFRQALPADVDPARARLCIYPDGNEVLKYDNKPVATFGPIKTETEHTSEGVIFRVTQSYRVF